MPILPFASGQATKRELTAADSLGTAVLAPAV